MEEYKNEIFYALFGRFLFGKFLIAKIDLFNEGTPTSVEFSYKDVINKINSGKNLVGFYHTHPDMQGYMSVTDLCTMSTWLDSEGKPLLCLIDGLDGLNFYYCQNDTNNVFSVKKCNFYNINVGNFIFGVIL